MGMPVIDYLFAIGPVRKAIWKMWYPFLTRRLRGEDVCFLNYAYEEEPPLALPLAIEDEPNRACIQLYHHVATQVSLHGQTVLEVSCGHGGGASYLTRSQEPNRYIGLDLNPEAIRFCQERHRIARLHFQTGDAEKLPFESGSFDAVINVEASHCYPDFPQFLAEVARVLRPGGHFLYADFRFSDGTVSSSFSEWDQELANAPLKLCHSRIITAEVLRGMDLNSKHSEALIIRRLPKFMHRLGRDFAGVRGSRIYNALQHGELSYRSYCLQKP